MSAAIIPLPRAAVAPVIQPKRRGRYPKKVICFYRARFKVSERLRTAGLDADLMAEARRMRAAAMRLREAADFALAEAAVMEAQAHTALRSKGRL